jgi:hypothetical protein
MACAEDVPLKAIYDAALSAWLGRRQGIINGVRPAEATFQFGKQLLQSRLNAANNLYEHSLSCPTCKASANSRFDGD